MLQDTAAQKCTMAYRAPELFNISSDIDGIDEKVDIWVSIVISFYTQLQRNY